LDHIPVVDHITVWIRFRFGSDSGLDPRPVWILAGLQFNKFLYCIYNFQQFDIEASLPLRLSEVRNLVIGGLYIRQQTLFNQKVDIYDPL